MSFPILIIGYSGSGKSTSIENLDPQETFLINACYKELPFRGGEKLYKEIDHQLVKKEGNKLTTTDYELINRILKFIHHLRPEIKNIIIDDSQYLIVNEFMKNHTNMKGNDSYRMYNMLADHFHALIDNCKHLRNDIFIFFLHHAEMTEAGFSTVKTIGRLLSEKIDVAGLFTICLFAKREGEHNYFYTQNDGSNPAKSPRGMFPEIKMPNDLQLIKSHILPYYEGE